MSKVTITHPIVGEQVVTEDHWKRMQGLKNGHGGWKIKTKENAKLSGNKKDTGKSSKSEEAK